MKRLFAIVLGLVLLFSFSASAFAADVSEGFTLYLRFDNSVTEPTDASKIDWFSLDVSSKKSFGDSEAYATVRVASGSFDVDAAALPTFSASIQNFGYTYNFSDTLSAGFMYDAGGVTLSGGELGSNWDWLHVAAFQTSGGAPAKGLLKVVASPVEGLTGGFYFDPVNTEYIVKGEYKTEGIKIGGGFTNAATLKADDRTYEVYGEFLPMDGARIYVDYLSDGKVIFDSSLELDPVTIAVLYSNEDKSKYGYLAFGADTVDISATYALSEDMSVVGGVDYNTKDSQLTDVYFEYYQGKLYVGVDQYLPDSETVIYGGYQIDDSNTLKASYDFLDKSWKVVLALSI